MSDKEKKLNEDIHVDDFTGLDDGLAGSSEDAVQGDYTIQQERIGGKVVNKRVGTFTQKTEGDKIEDGELPSLEEKLAAAEARFNAQFQQNNKTQNKEKNGMEP